MNAPSPPPQHPACAVTFDELVNFVRRFAGEQFPGDRPVRFTLELESAGPLTVPMPKGVAPTPDCVLSADGRRLVWFGRVYELTTNQAGPVCLLVEAYLSGVRDVSVAALVEAANSSADKPTVRDVFRRSAILEDDVVFSESRGTYRLRRPEEPRE